MSLEILRSDRLAGTSHGFFTRNKGVSSGHYSSLNCGLGSKDDNASVIENRARVTAALGVPAQQLRSACQVHSADAIIVSAEDVASARPRADAMVTRQKGLALGILTADCAPILFNDAAAAVIGAAHAGWKGALTGIVESTVQAMESLGAHRSSIAAVIGPCISQKAYAVGPEFRDRFIADDAAFARFFVQGSGDRLHFDLPGFTLHCLRAAGLQTPEWTGQCTFSDPDRFFSFRRTTHAGETDYGRQISVIAL